MPDFRIDWTGPRLSGDLVRDGTRFAEDGGLATAVVLSLFTDRRAPAGAVLPERTRDRRGYWGDGIAQVRGDRFGSLLWLLRRAKRTPATAVRAEQYAREALAWMVEDGVASEVEVSAELPDGTDRLDLDVVVHQATGASQRFLVQWSRIEGVIRLAA